MNLIRTISMYTDHDPHTGCPIEVTTVELYCYERFMTPEILSVLKRQQEMRLRSHVKAMPHSYWSQP